MEKSLFWFCVNLKTENNWSALKSTAT